MRGAGKGLRGRRSGQDPDGVDQRAGLVIVAANFLGLLLSQQDGLRQRLGPVGGAKTDGEEIHNRQNLEELDKLSLTVELPAFNPSLHRFQKIPVAIFNSSARQTGASKQLKKNQAEGGFDTLGQVEEDTELSDNTTMDSFLSGHYVIGSIIYRYSAKTQKISQEMTLLRREWPSRVNNIG